MMRKRDWKVGVWSVSKIWNRNRKKKCRFSPILIPIPSNVYMGVPFNYVAQMCLVLRLSAYTHMRADRRGAPDWPIECVWARAMRMPFDYVGQLCRLLGLPAYTHMRAHRHGAPDWLNNVHEHEWSLKRHLVTLSSYCFAIRWQSNCHLLSDYWWTHWRSLVTLSSYCIAIRWQSE